MRNVLIFLGTLTIGLAGGAAISLAGDTPAPATDTAPAVERVIHEEDPEWDCKTMGNRQCGVPTDHGTFLVTQYNSRGEALYTWER